MQLVWLRRDLRVIDNTALINAINMHDSVAVIFVATPDQWRKHKQSPIQSDLIFRRLAELKKSLDDLNIPLLYSEQNSYRDSVKRVVRLASSYTTESVAIHINREYELNEKRRDELLSEMAQSKGIEVKRYDDRCFLPPGSVLNGKQEMFKVFTPFKKKWMEIYSRTPFYVQRPVMVGDSVKLDSKAISSQVDEIVEFDESVNFSYPRKQSVDYPVSDDAISARLQQFCTYKLSDYHQNRDFPALAATSVVSPYLAIGALSVRQCMAAISGLSGSRTQGETRWLDELIWREFYIHLSDSFSALSKGEPFHSWGKRVQWQSNPVYFEAWCSGQTGYPIVDAAMRQLSRTGWMHNRLRMIVASFLTKDMLVDWRLGEDYFMSHLIDGDYASNNGGWQWCASTGCDGQPYFRIFNPITQSEKFDAQGEFIRQWVPELANVPDKYIHKPWQWISFDSLNYPAPIVDHKVQREIALSLYKAAKEPF
ncbi:deoxyribodipyrimidine photo-lyase [Vibrio hannami]|uniref:deoxyribodipyrimidine photo-lyase n=1 Tax=Vibrio hannami TaxID=2717094 RepID=UPI00240FE9C7|nr:deoxyribodipyrimidine photo-lyase [Vibrio hannami]MDG3086133.1 deoxyribodipyrimidine photo-lyase [Vibrio hannami]